MDVIEFQEKLGLSCNKFAKLMGVRRQTVYYWRAGKFKMSKHLREKFNRLCKTFEDELKRSDENE